jgi:hypothetical protein
MEVLRWSTTAASTPCYRSVVDDASPIGLFEVKASRRAGALEHWIATRASLAAAAQAVIDDLAPLLTVDERTRFLDAEGLHRPLAALADAVAGRSASMLYAWAAISALVCGELADIPACHATQAVLADPDDELAWDTFVDAVRSYCPPDLFDDVRGWADDPERSTTLVDRALESFAAAADDWSEDEREALAGLRAALGR